MKTLIFLVLLLVGINASNEAAETFAKFLNEVDLLHGAKVSIGVREKIEMGQLNNVQMIAKVPIAEGESIYQYPLEEKSLHLNLALKDPELGEIFSSLRHNPNSQAEFSLYDEEIMQLYLVYLKNRNFVIPGPENEWLVAYGNLLPKVFHTPLFWDFEELEHLDGVSIQNEITTTEELIENNYDALIPKLQDLYPSIFSREKYPYQAMKWAYGVYSSRLALKSPLSVVTLNPIKELYDYSDAVSAAASSPVKFVPRVVNHAVILDIVALEPFSEGDQIVIYDEPKSNEELLMTYGHVMGNNQHNRIWMGVGLDRSDSLFGNKKQFLHRKSLKDGQTYGVGTAEIPKDLIFALRIYHVTVYDVEEAENAFRHQMISSQNELKVVQTLIDVALDGIAKFKTTRKDDKSLLQALGPAATVVPGITASPEIIKEHRYRMALLYRMGEKKIYNSILKVAQQALGQVKANWAFRSMDIPGDTFHATPLTPDQLL